MSADNSPSFTLERGRILRGPRNSKGISKRSKRKSGDAFINISWNIPCLAVRASMQPILEEQKPSLRTVVNFLNVNPLNCIYIYVCEFNFVSRNIGKVGKIGLLKNDLWFWNKNILQEWNLKIVKLINLDLCQFFERWMKYILNLVFILGWENWFAIYLWKNVLKYKYFRY